MYSEISLPREATVNFQCIFPGNGITYINKHSQEKWIILTYSFLFSYSTGYCECSLSVYVRPVLWLQNSLLDGYVII